MNFRPLIYLLGISVALYAAYKAGWNSREILAEEERAALLLKLADREKKIDDSYTEYREKLKKHAVTVNKLEKELKNAKATESCVRNDDGTVTAYISLDVLRVLSIVALDPDLPENPFGATTEAGTVEADYLAGYAFYGIKEYNSCAKQLNQLIDSVKE